MAEAAPEVVEEAFALQTRAQALKVISADDAERNGEEDRIEVGLEGFNDAVLGEDKLRVGGDLHEDIGGSRQLSAARVDTTIRGDATLRYREYGAIMAGVLQEKHLNGSLLLAGMSDDLVGGGAVRLTAAVDLWAGNLVGIEEKIGTAISDGILAEAYVKMFDREYGAAVHVAGMAVFSGTVRLTTASGFWALNRVSTGVRQLNPGGGGGSGASAPAAPAPPPLPPVGVAAGAAAGGVRGGVRMSSMGEMSPFWLRAGRALTDVGDHLGDMRRLEELQNAAGLESTADIARSLEELSQNLDDIGQRAEDVDTLRRLTDPDAEVPAGMLRPVADPRTMTPDELAEWRRQNDADDWLSMLTGAAPQADEAAQQADDTFRGVVPATMAEADEMLAEVRRGLMPDGFDFDQAYTSFVDARSVDRTDTNIGSYFVLSAAHDELITHSDAMMAVLIRHADPGEARRLGEIQNLPARRAAMVAAIEEARQAGDIARVVELESILMGFDATAMRLIEQATASADAIRSLPTPKLPAGVNLGQLEDALQAEIDRLTSIQPKLYLDEQQQVMDQIGMYIKAKEMVANGDDPRPFLRDQAEYVRWQELQMQHQSATQQYPDRGHIYPMLTLEVIGRIENFVRVQGIQLDELQSLDDVLEARRVRIQADGRQAAGFGDIIAFEDAGQARQGDFVDAPAFMDDGLHYEDLDNLTRVDADVTVRQAEVPDPTPPPVPAARAQHADPDLTASWEWTPRRPAGWPPQPLDSNVNRTQLVTALRSDQTRVATDLTYNLPHLPRDSEARRHASQIAMEKQRIYGLVLEAIQRGEDPLVVLDNELALARYADYLDDARYAEEFGGTRLTGRVEAIDEVGTRVIERLVEAGIGVTAGEFNPGHKFIRIPSMQTPSPTPPKKAGDYVQGAEYATVEIAVPARVRPVPSLDESMLLPGELIAIRQGYEDLDSLRMRVGYDHLDPVNTGPARPGSADPDAISTGPARPGSGNGDPDALDSLSLRPERFYNSLEVPDASPYDTSIVHTLDPELTGSGYSVIQGTEALESEYSAIARSAEDASIYDMPPDAVFATHDTPMRTWSDWALADAREVVAWAENRSVFSRAWGRFKEMLYDVRDLPMVLVNSLFLNEGKIGDLMDLARKGRATRDSHRGSSGLGVMTLMEAQDIIRRADGTFDDFTPAGASPFAQATDAAEGHFNKLKLTPGGERWTEIFGRATRHGGSFGDADFDDMAGPAIRVPTRQGAPAVEPPPRVYSDGRFPIPKNFEDFDFDKSMPLRSDAHLSDSAVNSNQFDARISRPVHQAKEEIKDLGFDLLKRFDPIFNSRAELDFMSPADLRDRLLELIEQAEAAGDTEQAAKIRDALDEFERTAHRKMYDAVEMAEAINVSRRSEFPAHVDKGKLNAEFLRRFEFYDKKANAALAAGDDEAFRRHHQTRLAYQVAMQNLSEGADPVITTRVYLEHMSNMPLGGLTDEMKAGLEDALREIEAITNAHLGGKTKPFTDKQFTKIHRKHEQARLIQENLQALNLI